MKVCVFVRWRLRIRHPTESKKDNSIDTAQHISYTTQQKLTSLITLTGLIEGDLEGLTLGLDVPITGLIEGDLDGLTLGLDVPITGLIEGDLDGD